MSIRKFNEKPYFDDFNEDSKFYRVLYRPGFAVQARELNQVQSLTQAQISRFANSIFENGANVLPGEIKLDNALSYIKITSNFNQTDLSLYKGATIKSLDNSINGVISDVIAAENSDLDTIYLSYKQSDVNNNNQTFSLGQDLLIVFDHLTNITIPDESVTVDSDSSAVGKGTYLYLTAGLYYTKGYFVSTEQQQIVISKYSNAAELGEISVGFVIDEEIITPEQNTDLLDNATGASNETAPGAHRYKIDLNLVKKSDLTGLEIDESNYIEITKVIDGLIQKPARVNDYSILEDVLATRTFQESGDYVVDDFEIEIKEHLNDTENNGMYLLPDGGDETKLSIRLGSGNAYVKGYRVEKTSNTFLEIDKARDFTSVEDIFVPMQQGSYVIVDTILRTPELFKKCELKEGATQIGSAVVNAFSYTPGIGYRLYLTKINVDASNKSFDDVDTITQDTYSFSSNVITPGDLIRPTENSRIFKVPYSVIKNIDDVVFSKYEKFTSTINSGTVSLSTTVDQQFKDEVHNYIVESTNNGNIAIPTNVTITSGDNTQVNIDAVGFSEGENVEVIAEIRKTNLQPKIKSKVTVTETDTYTIDRTEIILGNFDGIELVGVTNGSIDYSSYFYFDNGQRDSHYSKARLILKNGYTDPGVDLDIEYSYYSHSAGDFFCAQSYPGLLGDVDIYNSFRLSDSVDFRPNIDTDNTTTGGLSFVPDSEIQLDFTYYLNRLDLIILDKGGDFSVVKGIPNEIPKEPETPQNSIKLYELFVPAYTFIPESVRVDQQEHRRYTMRDIGKIEKRLKTVEYYTALSLLESDAANKEFINKFKSGFVVDNFETQNVGFGAHPAFKCAIDPVRGYLRPEAIMKATNLSIKPGSSTHYQISSEGNIVTLPYSETHELGQGLASRTVRLNPFLSYSWKGYMKIIPESDFFVSVQQRPDIIIDGGVFETVAYSQNKNNLGTVWDAWTTSFTGVETTQRREIFSEMPREEQARLNAEAISNSALNPVRRQFIGAWNSADMPRGFRTVTVATSTSTQTRTGVTLETKETISNQRIGTRVVGTSVQPYMRSRNISFFAKGLKPNTKMHIFFDGVNQDHNIISSSPDNMITNILGDLQGVYKIPSSVSERFRTGIKDLVIGDSPFENQAVSFAKKRYSASGIIQERSNIIRSTKILDVERSITNETRTIVDIDESTGPWQDPIAQSFLHTLKGGCFFTSLDIYFRKINGNGAPVTAEIREMINGYPGPSVVPGSRITVDDADINSSDDATASTKFTFDFPIYLEENKEYCFVLLTNSETLEAWVSHLGDARRLAGDTNVNTGEQISKQPYLGSMFKSQNNKTWTASQYEDIKFELYRASFDINTDAEVVFNNKTLDADLLTEIDPHYIQIDNSAIETISGSDIIKINHRGHGFEPGDTVELYRKVDSTVDIGGIPKELIFNTYIDGTEQSTGVSHSILPDIDVDWYKIQISGNNATNSGYFGNTIFTTQNIDYSLINIISEDIIVANTNIAYTVRGSDKSTGLLDTVGTNIIPKENVTFNVPKKITQGGSDELLLTATLTSDKEHLSPILDEERLGAICVANRINNKSDSSEEAVARYFLKDNVLVNPADQLNVYFDINRPSSTNVEVYYKVQTADSDINFEDEDWVLANASSLTPVSDDINHMDEYVYEIPVGFDFVIFSIKIVMKSSNSAKVPEIKNFRTIALKG